MTQEELLSVAEIIERLVKRFEEQGAEHARKMAEHRASFGARTESDAKIIEGLRQQIETLNREERAAHDALVPLVDRVVKERDALLLQVQDQREEINRLNDAHGKTQVERNALRAEVAALRGTLDMVHVQIGIFRRHLRLLGEVLAEYPVGHSVDELREPDATTPKQHPVSIGGYVRRTKYSDQCPIGTIGKVAKVWSMSYDVDLVGVVGENCGYWDFVNCEPCDPPQTEPTPKRAHPVAVGGYLRRLTGFNTTPAGEVVRVEAVEDVEDYEGQIVYVVRRPNGQLGRWTEKNCESCDPPVDHDTSDGKEAAKVALLSGEIKVGDVVRAKFWKPSMTAKVTEILPDGRLMLDASSEPWKVDEVVKMISKVPQEAAEAVIRDSQMTEIKVGDVVEVVSNTGGNTWLADVGSVGTVTSGETIEDSLSVRLADVPGKKNVLVGYVSLCDVRKVPQ